MSDIEGRIVNDVYRLNQRPILRTGEALKEEGFVEACGGELYYSPWKDIENLGERDRQRVTVYRRFHDYLPGEDGMLRFDGFYSPSTVESIIKQVDAERKKRALEDTQVIKLGVWRRILNCLYSLFR